MFRDDDQHSKKWNEDLYEYEKSKKSSAKNTEKKNKVLPKPELKENSRDEYAPREFKRPVENNGQRSPFNYKTVLLLCVFLGPLGVHRFYVEKKKSGAIMLILSLTFFGLVAIIWNIFDLVAILSEKFKDNQERSIVPDRDTDKKNYKLLGVLGFIISGLLFITITSFNTGFWTALLGNGTNNISDLVKEKGEVVETVPYEFNKPIEIFDYKGENTGTITAKSARMVMGEEAMVEVTYEITKKNKDFSDDAELLTFNGTFTSSLIYNRKYRLEESYLGAKVTELLGLKNNQVSWYEQLEGTTLSVTKYYTYKSLKENFCIGVPLYDQGKEKMAMIDLMPLVEDKTIDLRVADQKPVTKQSKVTVPLGQEKRVLMIDIKVNRSKIGKGKNLPLGTTSLYEDENYVVLDVELKNNSAVTLTEDDIFYYFKLLNDDFYGEDDYFVWNDTIEQANENLSLKPGEHKKVAFVFVTYEKLPKKEKDIYFVYNPNYEADKDLTKFSIVE